MAELLEVAKRVKRGVRLLDRKFPTWRKVLRQHEAQFNIKDGECCVLGTLEHFHGRAKVLAKRKTGGTGFIRLTSALQIFGSDYGFDRKIDFTAEKFSSDEEYAILQALWRAEFEQ